MKHFLKSLRTLISLPAAMVVAVALFSGVALADSAFRDMQGNITTLEDQQTPGQWTVVMIWASDCHICNKEVGEYSAFHQKYIDKNANIVGISIDGKEGKADAEAFIERNKVLFPSLIADISAVANWYQMRTGEAFRATPTFVLIDGKGEVRAAQAGAVPTKIIEDFIASNS